MRARFGLGAGEAATSDPLHAEIVVPGFGRRQPSTNGFTQI
jgi:hypothetical protein